MVFEERKIINRVIDFRAALLFSCFYYRVCGVCNRFSGSFYCPHIFVHNQKTEMWQFMRINGPADDFSIIKFYFSWNRYNFFPIFQTETYHNTLAPQYTCSWNVSHHYNTINVIWQTIHRPNNYLATWPLIYFIETNWSLLRETSPYR